ncbi:MAG: MoxR family ATPase [Saprospiraceae bacterium]|nr:MoxR family ATPase [Saprospiraceae bacterium]
MAFKNRYTGTGLLQAREFQGETLAPYLPSPELLEAVNLAIHLNRPLLLKGEPGCGKSYLAKAVACELGLPLETLFVKSTTKAREALYSYNHIGHLRDAQLANTKRLDPEEMENRENSFHYVQFGPIGRAFQGKEQCVLLIDEIDKADIDFPNDLLQELELQTFNISELEGRKLEKGQSPTLKAVNKPIVFITSNDEKPLPAPFLRRCIFHRIQFPGPDRLEEIIRAHLKLDASKETASEKALVKEALKRFDALRQQMTDDLGGAKKASTSELIDWFKVLTAHPADEMLQALQGNLPFPGILLKSAAAHERFLKNNS